MVLLVMVASEMVAWGGWRRRRKWMPYVAVAVVASCRPRELVEMRERERGRGERERES